MKQAFYLLQNGQLKREANTIVFQNKKIKKFLPVHKISQIFCLGETTVNTHLLTFLTQNHIPIYYFDYYGNFIGSYAPREYLLSGKIVVKQAEHYLDPVKRMKIAIAFVKATQGSMLTFLDAYQKRGYNFKREKQKITPLIHSLASCSSITHLMNLEAESWKTFYSILEKILDGTPFSFDQRTRRPPHNEVNALISFLNSILYTTTLTEIYHTQLNPTISFLHEPGVRRYSLALDIAELFKAYCTFRTLIKLIRKKQLKSSHFLTDWNKCLLTDKGKEVVLQEFEKRMKSTHKVPNLHSTVSTRRLIRLEGYKLIKHLLGEKHYVTDSL